MATYYFAMAIVTWIITGIVLIELVVKLVGSCMKDETGWCKATICFNFLAFAAVGIALGFLFNTVSTLL